MKPPAHALHRPPATRRAGHRATSMGFAGWLVVTYLIFDYIRPHDYFPVLAPLHPQMVTLLVLVAAWLFWGEKSALKDPITRAYGLFLLLAAASVVFAVNGYWTYMTTRQLTIYLLGAFLPFIAFLSEPAKLQRFFVIWILVQLVMCVIAIFHGAQGPGSFLEDDNDLALALNIAIPYAYFLAQGAIGLAGRLFYLGIVATFVIGVVATGSRGGFVGLVAATGGILLFSAQRVRNLLILACLAVGVLIWAPASYFAEIETISDPTQSTRINRLYLWRRGWEMFVENPVLGIGAGNYPWRVQEYEMKSGEYVPGSRQMGGRAAHSLYFTVLPEMGILGTVVYGTMVVLVFRRVRRVARLGARGRHPPPEVMRLVRMARAVLASLFAFFAGGAFLSVLYYPHFWYAAGFAVALERASRRAMEDAHAEAGGPAPEHEVRHRPAPVW